MDVMLQPFSSLLADGRDSARIIALDCGRPVTLGQLRADVSRNAARFDLSSDRDCILLASDSYVFLVGLLAILQARLTVLIPANSQRGTLAAVARDTNRILSDVPLESVEADILLQGGDDPGPLPALVPEEGRIAFYTSGSTGTPKRVVRQIAHLEREVETVHTLLVNGPQPSSVSSTVPHQHAYGIIFKLLWPLAAGVPFSTVNHDFLESLVGEIGPGSMLVTSPSHLSRVGGMIPLAPSKRPVRIMSAGAPLSAAAAGEAAAFFGCPVTEIFGSTETGAFATRQSAGDEAQWRSLKGIRTAQETDGRLKIWSPAIPGDSWFTSEDLVEIGQDGGFRFLGRADRVVKLEGKRISLVDVENQLCGHPWVRSARVVVVGSAYKRLGAAIVLNEFAPQTRQDNNRLAIRETLRQHLLQSQEPAGIPRAWRFVDSLPAGIMGKVADRDIEVLFKTEPLK